MHTGCKLHPLSVLRAWVPASTFTSLGRALQARRADDQLRLCHLCLQFPIQIALRLRWHLLDMLSNLAYVKNVSRSTTLNRLIYPINPTLFQALGQWGWLENSAGQGDKQAWLVGIIGKQHGTGQRAGSGLLSPPLSLPDPARTLHSFNLSSLLWCIVRICSSLLKLTYLL